MERVEVLDEATLEPRDVLPRGEAHRRGLLHRCVHVFVLRPDRRLWLQKRGLDRRLYPGLWTSSASGHVAAGDTEHATALREAEEELGLDLRAAPPRRVAEFRFRDAHEHEVSGLWVAESGARPRPRPPEVLAVMALGREELAARIAAAPWSFAPSFLAALRAWDAAAWES